MGNKTSCGTVRFVIILVINNRTPAADFFTARMITDRIGLHSVLRCSDRCGIGFPSPGENKTNYRKTRAYERVCSHLYMYYVILVTTSQ